MNSPATGLDALLGVHLGTVTPDGGTATLDLDARLQQPWGIVHGGVYCAMIETLASVSAFIWFNDPAASGIAGGGTVVGVNNNTDFLRAVSTGTITARSTPIHRGRRQQLWLVTVEEAAGRALARGQVRLQNLPPQPPSTGA